MRTVKITKDDDGYKIKYAKWCAIINFDGSPRSFCTGQVFGYGESSVVYETSQIKKVTCKQCIERINYIKQY